MSVRLTTDVSFNIPKDNTIPDEEILIQWASKAYQFVGQGEAELSILIVDEVYCAELNSRYRQKNKSTNVLSFPAETVLPDGMRLLGDIVICAPVVLREAQAMNLSPKAHWLHMMVHGLLHLLGHDHGEELQAQKMESLEAKILAEFDIENPYI